MKVLITGAGGYIGSILVPTLLREGFQVIAVDNFMYGQSSLLDCCYDKNFQLIRGDVRDATLIRKVVAEADVLIPLACLVGAPLCDIRPVEARTINLEAVQLLMKHSRPDQMVLYPTTNSGYGIGQDNIYCTEETPLRPISLYGQLKADAEKCVLDRGNSISFRLATVFGMSPRMRLDLLVNDFTYRAVNDRFIVLFESSFKRNFIHVRDVVAAFLHGIRHFETLKNSVYNVGLSSANVSKKELCDAIRRHVRDFVVFESDINKDPDQRNYIVSNEKIEKTGFRPAFSLDDGIQELIKGFQVVRKNSYSNVV